ncbi:uncharacterized protein PRCAT00004442001 [Priceomyces carsonii]|uniref:uncharacterized protein n=1 Tax=Priceomyces carsonii TaxID=28549 RepID=UPI002ED97675|nr:unnamed protein product [Priceomyces carsonii]
MVLEKNKLSPSIDECAKSLKLMVDDFVSSNDFNYLLELSDASVFEPHETILEDQLLEDSINYTINFNNSNAEGTGESSSLENDVAIFNADLDQKTKQFIISIAFQRAIDLIIAENILNSSENELKNIKLGSYYLTINELKFYNAICLLLDFQIFKIDKGFASIKSSFFSNISQVLDMLICKSTEAVDKFWFYMESRRSIIQQKIFDRNAIADRISLLEICNTLTDKLSFKTSQGKRDSYKKDTFNDLFQYRVRVFIANVFAFEDNTGLNKYFLTSNRMVKEIVPATKYRNEREFLKDVIQVKKLFNDPYFFLKPSNQKNLQKTSETMHRVYKVLIEDEITYAATVPKVDQFAVPKPISEYEAQYLKQRYEKKIYFPESYWITPFEDTRRDSSYEKYMQEDLSFFETQFENSKYRQTLLLQIYIICSLFYELNSSNKREFLKSLKAPTNIKHLTDDSPPDSLVSLYYKIKREMLRSFRSIDNQFSFLLQHLTLTEISWYGWLIFGKDHSTGKSLFYDKLLNSEELKQINEKRSSVFPFKTKRYFNLYATPQLSRKMKIPTGLERLEDLKNVGTIDYQQHISGVNEKIDDEVEPLRKAQILEERNVLIWKQFRKMRSTDWLKFGDLLNPLMLTSISKDSHDSRKRLVDSDDTLNLPESKRSKA